MSSLSHLFFGNDVLMFGQANRGALESVKEAIDLFSSFSGMEVNWAKSRVIFSKSLDQAQDLANILGIPLAQLPIKYLGLPLTKGKLCYRDCGALLTSVEKTLDRWKTKWLSYAGRVQLLNWVFQGKVNFWLQAT